MNVQGYIKVIKGKLHAYFLTRRMEKIWKEVSKRNANVPDEELNAETEEAKQYARRFR